jgi:hypothetical protein
MISTMCEPQVKRGLADNPQCWSTGDSGYLSTLRVTDKYTANSQAVPRGDVVMGSLDDEEETQRVLIGAVMTASGISCQDAWCRYVEYTGLVDVFAIDAYLAGLMPLPLEECNLLAHAVNELIDEQPLPARAPHRGATPWCADSSNTADNDALDELLRQWLLSSKRDQTGRWQP